MDNKKMNMPYVGENLKPISNMPVYYHHHHGYGYGYGYGYGGGYRCGFTIIVVLFILLIIVGTTSFRRREC